MTLRLFFMRHGETEWSLSGQYSGHADIPLTDHGEDEARQLGKLIHSVPFDHVLTSPLQRARQTCELAGLSQHAKTDTDLVEWNNGDYEGRTPADILTSRPGWNLFRDGCPNGEMPTQLSARADRLIHRLTDLEGNVALFSHCHLGRVLAARWIGLSVEHAQQWLLTTASLSILCYEHDRRDQHAIELWNSTPFERFAAKSDRVRGSAAPIYERAIQRWENEGGETPSPLQDAGKKQLIVFDLDGTLARSKSPLDAEMAVLLTSLLNIVKVAVISGGAWPQFEKQVLAKLPHHAQLEHLSILPTCGTKFYQFAADWKPIYSEDFDATQKAQITNALTQAVDSTDTRVSQTWGEQIDDRGSQITFSGLGQQAPIEEKEKWDPDFSKRKKIKAVLGELIPDFSVNLGGMTSIDVTKPGIDKAYGIRKLRDTLAIAISDMIFIGDAIFPGGNDYPAKQAGAISICVRDPGETKRVVEAIIACLSASQTITTERT
ncbi:MAG: HAD-IIB family hydrolase [Pirellulales bacterium]